MPDSPNPAPAIAPAIAPATAPANEDPEEDLISEFFVTNPAHVSEQPASAPAPEANVANISNEHPALEDAHQDMSPGDTNERPALEATVAYEQSASQAVHDSHVLTNANERPSLESSHGAIVSHHVNKQPVSIYRSPVRTYPNKLYLPGTTQGARIFNNNNYETASKAVGHRFLTDGNGQSASNTTHGASVSHYVSQQSSLVTYQGAHVSHHVNERAASENFYGSADHTHPNDQYPPGTLFDGSNYDNERLSPEVDQGAPFFNGIIDQPASQTVHGDHNSYYLNDQQASEAGFELLDLTDGNERLSPEGNQGAQVCNYGNGQQASQTVHGDHNSYYTIQQSSSDVTQQAYGSFPVNQQSLPVVTQQAQDPYYGNQQFSPAAGYEAPVSYVNQQSLSPYQAREAHFYSSSPPTENGSTAMVHAQKRKLVQDENQVYMQQEMANGAPAHPKKQRSNGYVQPTESGAQQPRPPMTYPVLCAMAMTVSQDGQVKAADVYTFVERFSYYQTADPNWKCSVRNALGKVHFVSQQSEIKNRKSYKLANNASLKAMMTEKDRQFMLHYFNESW